MKLRAIAALLPIVVFAVMELGSQTPQASITISAIPDWGQDGQIAGNIYGIGSQQVSLYLFAFVPDVGWFGLPGNCVQVNVQGGQFSTDATPDIKFRSATRFTAYLMPANVGIQCNSGTGTPSVPFVFQKNSVASVSLPRIPRYPTLSFGGLEWFVKDTALPVSPGPQYFIQNNAFVDSAGQLHLRITPCSGSWCAAEVFTRQTVGYGNYRFTIGSQMNNLDPNVTLGLFSWDGQAGDQNNREWDIEFSRWGNANSPTNAQYVVQPYNGPNNIQRFLTGSGAPSTHSVVWTPGQVGFVSSGPTNNLINQWTFNSGGPTPVPTPGDVHLHLNFYVAANQRPNVAATQEVVISAFQYVPSNPQIGFARSSDNVSVQAQTYAVPLVSSSPNCTALVESDSPWLSVAGSGVIPAGVTVTYAASSNAGNRNGRTGNLILQSTNCNATLGSQVLTVTQPGLVCAPSFAAQSTSLGFLPAVFSVFIQGTAPTCTWNLTSSAPWLQVGSPASGSGDGSVQVAASLNPDASLRGAVLSLNNGPTHSVYQDATGSLFAISPQNAASCGSQAAPFGVSWNAPGNVEIHLNSPSGPLFGQFASTGTARLPALSDGTLLFLVLASGAPAPITLATARAGVSPSLCNIASISPLGLVNAASYLAGSLAPGSLAAVFGTNFSSTTAQATGSSYPTTLGGASISLGGQACHLWYVSPSQINFQVPAGLAPGRYTLAVGAGSSDVLITNVSPGIFTLKGDGTGVPLATVIGRLKDGTTVSPAPYQCSGSGCAAVPMTILADMTDLYIVLYGTGIRNYHTIQATLGSSPMEVAYVGAQEQYPGLDQVNLHMAVPVGFGGLQALRLQVDGAYSNPVTLEFQ